MLNEVKCDLCGSSDADVVFASTISGQVDSQQGYSCSNDGHGEHYQIVRCRACGLCYCSPRPGETAIECGYQGVQDPLYQEQIQGRRKTFQRNLRNLSKHKKEGDLLDIGCYLGVFLDEARKIGWKVNGIEPSRWCVEEAEKTLGLKIQQGTYKDAAAIQEKFDAITMWDVLEHVDSPLDALRIAHSALKEDGVLAFSTIDIGSWYARFLGRKWPWLMTMHIYYFDRKRICQYLEKAGFHLLEIRCYKHIISLDYLIYKLKRISKFLYYAMRFYKKVLNQDKKYFLTIGMGDVMEVYARKTQMSKGIQHEN